MCAGRESTCAGTCVLRTAHRVRTQVGSPARLISGGLAPGTEIDIIEWVEEMARLGGLDLIDGLGINPYSPIEPDDPGACMTRLEDLHRRLTYFGRPDLKLWLTEYGAPVSPAATGWAPAGLTEEQQVEWMRLAFALATQLPFVENLTWFEYRDSCADPGDAECRFGLLRHDYSPRPIYHTLRDLVAENTRLQPRLGLSLAARAGQARLARRGDGRISRPSSRYVYVEGWLFLPGSPSSNTPLTLRVLRRGAAPRTMNLVVRNGGFSVRVGRRERRRWKIEGHYAGSSIYAPVGAALAVAPARSAKAPR